MRLTMASPKPVPRSLVEKYGKEELLAKLTGHAMPCVRYADLHEVRWMFILCNQRGGDLYLTQERIASLPRRRYPPSSATTRLMDSASAMTAGRSLANAVRSGEAVKPAGEHGKRRLYDMVDVCWLWLRGRKPRERGKFVHQRPHGFHGFVDGFAHTKRSRPAIRGPASTPEQPGPGASGCARPIARSAVSGFLISCATRLATFAPSHLLLRLQQFAQVLKNDHVTKMLAIVLQRKRRSLPHSAPPAATCFE